MTSQTFRYGPLSQPDEIRLLILEPAATNSSPLRGCLQNTTISACDRDLIDSYTALSYVWGNPSPSDSIALGQADAKVTSAAVSHPITANLAAALRGLRDTRRPHRIWADALCINQSDIPERNVQVALMGDIYRKASHTVIYLGTLTQGAATVLDAADANLPLPADSDAAAAAADVLGRPWFRRVWIFQELVLSADPWVQCGPRRVRWRALCACLRDHEDAKTLLDMNVSYEGASPGDLFYILENRRGFEATDPRDVVFANVGLARDREAVLAAVGIDYAAPVDDVYTAVARYYLATRPSSLNQLLARAGLESATVAGLASWAPDWSVALPQAALMYADQMLSRERPKGLQYVLAGEKNVLAALGCHVDVVKHVSLVLPSLSVFSEPSREAYGEIVKEILALYHRQGGVYWSGDEFGRHARVGLRGVEKEHQQLCSSLCREWQRLFRSLPLLDGGSSPPNTSHEAAAHEKFLGFFARWAADESKKERIFAGGDSEGMPWLMYEYLSTTLKTKVLEGRRLVSTAGGRCGVVPSKARRGDLIVNLANSDVTYVLRAAEVKELPSLGDLNKEILAGMTSLDGTPLANEGVTRAGSQIITHCRLVGECYLDGQVGWAYGGGDPDYSVYAMR